MQRTFHIRSELGDMRMKGTAFTFEKDGIQYLATARHTFPFTTNGQEINYSIMHNNEWDEYTGNIFFKKESNLDQAIITLNSDFSPRLQLEVNEVGIYAGADVYFLGFPFGEYYDDKFQKNNGFPFPYVKKATVSILPILKDDYWIMFLDGINNIGFSGGPCVYINPQTRATKLIGTIKGYLPEKEEITTPMGKFNMEFNSGIIEVHTGHQLLEIETSPREE